MEVVPVAAIVRLPPEAMLKVPSDCANVPIPATPTVTDVEMFQLPPFSLAVPLPSVVDPRLSDAALGSLRIE